MTLNKKSQLQKDMYKKMPNVYNVKDSKSCGEMTDG